MGPEQKILNAIRDLPRELQLKVLMDVQKRITDWRVSGGKDDDVYIDQQIRYAENVAKSYAKKRLTTTK